MLPSWHGRASIPSFPCCRTSRARPQSTWLHRHAGMGKPPMPAFAGQCRSRVSNCGRTEGTSPVLWSHVETSSHLVSAATRGWVRLNRLRQVAWSDPREPHGKREDQEDRGGGKNQELGKMDRFPVPAIADDFGRTPGLEPDKAAIEPRSRRQVWELVGRVRARSDGIYPTRQIPSRLIRRLSLRRSHGTIIAVLLASKIRSANTCPEDRHSCDGRWPIEYPSP